jgi:hypothetical protein
LRSFGSSCRSSTSVGCRGYTLNYDLKMDVVVNFSEERRVDGIRRRLL